MHQSRQSFRGRWVFPVSSPPLENGTIEIQDGQIVAVHDRSDPLALDLGNVAVIPGLVNAHTHLEFSDLSHPLEPALPFTTWIRNLVGQRRHRTNSVAEAVRTGYREAAQAGTTLIGEIATEGWSSAALTQPGPRIVAFRELLALTPDRHAEQMDVAAAHLQEADAAPPQLVRGISPHAPYSVHPDLFRDLVQLAKRTRAPLAIHLAETQAELELLADGTGEFVDMLQQFGVWQPGIFAPGARPLDYLESLAELERALVIHGNYLSSAEMAFLADNRHLTVVYCPRTHAFFRHSAHPWLELRDQGVSLALGTDSRGSSPDLSLWNELLFLHGRYPDVSPATLLNLGTLSGARALGFDALTGSLEAGKSADLAVIQLGAQAQGDAFSLLFGPQSSVHATMCAGEWL